MDTSEPEAEMRERVEVMVAGGYLPLDQIEFDAADYLTGAYEELDDDALAAMAKRLVEVAARSHAEEQASWPEMTDCDRLEAACASLEERGILCGQHTGFTQGDGGSEMMDRVRREREAGRQVRGYAFFHEQDVEGAVQGGGLALAFGRVEGEANLEPDARIGETVVEHLREHGLTVEWNGESRARLLVKLRWQRRRHDLPPPPRSFWRRLFNR